MQSSTSVTSRHPDWSIHPGDSFHQRGILGITNLRERQDEHYLASHYDINPEEIVILDHNSVSEPPKPEETSDFLSILSYAEANNLEDPSHLTWIDQRIDIKNLMQYFAFNIYIANIDWPWNNLFIWRKTLENPDNSLGRGLDGR